MSKERLGGRPDFDEWANTVVAAIKQRRSHVAASRDRPGAQDRNGVRGWASRMFTKIAA